MSKAVVLRKYGSVAELELSTINPPQTPRSGRALIKINAVGLNPRDIAVIQGKFKLLTGRNFPKPVGADFAGEILGLPEDNTQFKIGDRVFGYMEGLRAGVSRQICEIPLKYLVATPNNIEDEIAAALGCAYLTAYQSLIEKAAVKPGDKVLVYGAAGGVGTAAIHLLKLLGADIAAVSHSRNEQYCLEQGADSFFAYDKQNVFAGSERYEVFFQVYSEKGNLYSKGRKLLKKNGHYISLIPNPVAGLLGGFMRPTLSTILVKSSISQLKRISEWVQKGEVIPNIQKVYCLESFQEAFHDLREGKVNGKIVLSMLD